MSGCTAIAPRGCGDEAIAAATGGAKGTTAERAWGALDRDRKASRLLGSAELVQGAPVAEFEVALQAPAKATKPLVLGFARVDGQLKVDRAPVRALDKVAIKGRRAFDKAAKQAAQQGGIRSCPPGPALETRQQQHVTHVTRCLNS